MLANRFKYSNPVEPMFNCLLGQIFMNKYLLGLVGKKGGIDQRRRWLIEALSLRQRTELSLL